MGVTHAQAEPPPWAPAHGYRAKHGHKHKHKGRRGGDRYYDDRTQVDRTFGILDGNCNRELLGQVLGGAAGAAVGSQVGSGSGTTAAIVGGAIIGALIGGQIGRQMDQVDQNCVGQVLEHAETGQTVNWQNPDDGGQYSVTPRETYQRGDGRYCREYTAKARVGGDSQTVYGTACRQPDGSWELIS
ncbi:glycine zipper 2TM domain-containing protein [Ferruginivarius sediminum]|uniref:Glycine zipper 2TM domain-containing protein n=2 Tax=Ferruginivarius sediminum TaxID=2661937 RepID=A0A369TGX5_9PROT|nr:glycine zipper 2TM domain-containing protein [Ferruginivarius sediminum]